MKTCRRCGERKRVAEYHAAKGCKDGTRNVCKVCVRARMHAKYHSDVEAARAVRRRDYRRNSARIIEANKKWKAANRDKMRRADKNTYLIRTYGIDLAEFERRVLAQGGVCLGCKEPCNSGRDLCVDHNHQTLKVRDLLCVRCNSAVERVEMIPGWAHWAMQYLIRHAA